MDDEAMAKTLMTSPDKRPIFFFNYSFEFQLNFGLRMSVSKELEILGNTDPHSFDTRKIESCTRRSLLRKSS